MPAGCDEFDPNALTVEQARARILEALPRLHGEEWLALRSALGRVLAHAVHSPVDVPAYANSAMDGYAVRAEDLGHPPVRLTLAGTAAAGHPYAGTVQSGQCVRIMTGAKLPDGADAVVMQEHVQREGEFVTMAHSVPAGENVRAAGGDVARGAEVLGRGHTLRPADLGLIASLGIGEVAVRRRPRVAFFSTGDELRQIGQTLADGQIYDSNRYTLHGMLQRVGVDLLDMGVVRDTPQAVEAAFAAAREVADVVITTGGVSVGDADYVKDTLARLGKVDFWKIAMKPGRPLAFGLLSEDTAFFGLPGNPVSAMATFYQFVQPALKRLAGAADALPLTLRAVCVEPLRKTPGRVDFQRGILGRDGDGRLTVRSTGPQGSHVLHSMTLADCFIVLPREWGNVAAGTEVEVQPFAALI
ncbi:molybdopterin molybdotransferase MoeA [Ectothiorhodospiraceae bacterium 2226]|nr:molybdopterin molybdotransferase MoeA [Ectothiorhodospiraceae bacterium 2226]